MNLKHLRYFWAVARWGGVNKAAQQLHLTPQTLSGQIKELEAQLGVALFQQSGRRLELTDAGRIAYAHAQDLFRISDELQTALQTLPGPRAIRFRVGITDGVPRPLAHRLLEAARAADERLRLACSHEPLEKLLADLALHRLDLVLSDRPVPAGAVIRAYSHPLGVSGLGLFAVRPLARLLRRDFPASLHGQPLLLPGPDNAANRAVLGWLEEHQVVPRIVGEFDDGALMKTFGTAGGGVLPAPLAMRGELERHDGLELIGVAEGLSERYYALSVERRGNDPITRRVLEAAGSMLAPEV